MDQDDNNNGGEITFSFISPVYNEQDGLENFYQRLSAVAKDLGEPYEIIFINDGSTDGTDEILGRLSTDDACVKVVEFSRNFGHQVAVTAGYDHACGRAVICLDADCQHPPEVIPDLVGRWREGFEVVYTVRRDTEGISAARRLIGRLVYKVIRLASGVDLTDQADFRLMDRVAVDALRSTREHARFVRALVRWIGFRQTSIPYTAEARTAGESKYSLRQLAGMATAGVFNFSVRPLRLMAAVGAVLVAVGLLYALISLILWPFGAAPVGLSNLAMTIVALFGLQFLMFGLLGEYVGRIFDEAKARPLYVLRQKYGFDRQGDSDGQEGEQAEQMPPENQESNGITVYT